MNNCQNSRQQQTHYKHSAPMLGYSAEELDLLKIKPLESDKIPRQKLPGWIRWPLRVVVLPFVWLDMLTGKISKWLIRPPYRRIGKCSACGRCCHCILIDEPHDFWGACYLWWNREINGFYLRRQKPVETESGRMLVMSCRYLVKGCCQHYFLRPSICRRWPEVECFDEPQIMNGCSYQVVERSTKH
ncbi:MAG: hypothetical protein ACQEP8_02455 [Chlamydiota bacterium]